MAAVADITRAARVRFGDHGYEATSIDDIAADAGRTKGAVYHHFADKRALFEYVFAVEQREIAEIVVRSTALPDGVDAYLRTLSRRPRAARITLIEGPMVLGWERWRSCDDGPFRSLLRGSLDAYPSLDEHYDLDLLTDLLLGAVTEAAQQVATADKPVTAARRYGTQLRTMINGVVGPVTPRS